MIDFIKSWVLCMALTVVGVMIFSDCGEDPANKNEYQIGYLLTLDHPYWQNMRLGAVDEGKKLDAKVTILNAKEDPVLQIMQIKEMIFKFDDFPEAQCGQVIDELRDLVGVKS